MVRLRRGRSKLGCLVSLLIVVAAGYFVVNVGRSYLNFFEYQDAMRQEARFAVRRTDEQIRHRLAAKADSLGLPEAAGKITIRRINRQVFMESDYYDTIEFPGFVREVHFNPRAQGVF